MLHAEHIQMWLSSCGGHLNFRYSHAQCRPSSLCAPFTRRQRKQLRQPELRQWAVSSQQFRPHALPTQLQACGPARHQSTNLDKLQWQVYTMHYSGAPRGALRHLRHALRDLCQRPSTKFPDISNSAAQLLPHGWPLTSVRFNNRSGTSALLAALCYGHAVPPVVRHADAVTSLRECSQQRWLR